jgi:hypothetical protein
LDFWVGNYFFCLFLLEISKALDYSFGLLV